MGGSVVLQRWIWVVFSVFLLAGCGPTGQTENEMTEPGFPNEVSGWRSVDETQHFDTESIYSYIDGHAEVYLAYGMKRCLSQRYAAVGGEDEIVVDLFEMASPADAFGVYSHDRAGEEVEVGRGGVYRHGWLSFWTGSWYGSVYASGSGESTREAVLEVGRAVAAGLPNDGEAPDLVFSLPPDGLDPTSVCFLRSPQILGAHIFVGSGNVLRINPEVEAVVGRYAWDGSTAHLVVVRYPSVPAAEAVERAAVDDAASGVGSPEMVFGRNGSMVAVVVGSETGGRGEDLLASALGG